MHHFNIRKIVPLIVTVLIFAIIIFFETHRKTILILHSYAPDYSWVRDVNEGIKRVLKDNSFINIRWHYMDTKNHPNQASYKEKAGMTARRVIDFVMPNVLVAIDDDAQEFAAKFYKDKPGIYIVYAGVNAMPERYSYEKASNVVGILERVPIQGVKDAIFLLAKKMKMTSIPRVSHVSDKSQVVQFDDHNMHTSKDWHPMKLGPSFLVETYDDWKHIIKNAHKHMDFMLISNYRKLAIAANNNKMVPYKDAMKWAFENSSVPIIGINGFVCEDGAALSIATSPFEQGEVAMQMAIDLAMGTKNIKDIHVTQTSQYIVVFNEARFQKYGLHLPGVYKAFAKAIDRYSIEDK